MVVPREMARGLWIAEPPVNFLLLIASAASVENTTVRVTHNDSAAQSSSEHNASTHRVR